MTFRLCKKCRAMVREATREALRRKKNVGVHVGRPRKQVGESVLALVRSGELSTAQAAALIGVTPMTIRRRLKD